MNELDSIVDALRKVEGIGPKVAKRAAAGLEAALKKTLSAGTTPSGEAWAPRKEGGRAYAHAADKLTSASDGNVLRVKLTGPDAYGHFGARGAPVRQMLPDAGGTIPAMVVDVMRDAAETELAEALK